MSDQYNSRIIRESVENKRIRVQKHIEKIKAWCRLFPIYLLASVVIGWLVYIMKIDGVPNFILYILFLGPCLWWSHYVIQGLELNFSKLEMFKKWEEHQMKKILQEDDEVI